MKKEDYNDVPVTYCADCLSLRVKEEDGYLICGGCGNDVFDSAHVDDWDKRFQMRYDSKYLDWK